MKRHNKKIVNANSKYHDYDQRIAVIGMACRFPGADDVEEYWNNIVSGKNSVSFFSNQELNKHDIHQQLILDESYIKARGVLKDIYCFDAEFFGFSPYEAKVLDPQQRLLLELAWTVLEDAGYAGSKYTGCIGVYAGMSDSTYLQNNLYKNREFLNTADEYQLMISTSSAFLSSRISYLLDLKGPSININTACSTSLAAIVVAAKSLINHDCNIAMAGGVSVVVPQEQGYVSREGSVFSPTGQCRAFDAGANGIVRSNGAGVVLLKRLSDAIADGDKIEAILNGYAINNDGADKAGYTAPSINEQANCVKMALSMARINPEEVGYVEAHGTGTPLGDPIEIAALTKAFSSYTCKKNYCAIGSVKTNIGHTDVASGVAGFIKAVLSVKNGILPPNIHYNTANPNIDFEESPFFVNTEYRKWDKNNSIRKAIVNSLGMGGTNACVVLSQFQEKHTIYRDDNQYCLLPYSALNQNSLLRAKEKILDFLEDIDANKSKKCSLENIAYTFQQKRLHFDCRDYVVANTLSSAIDALKKKDSGDDRDLIPDASLLCFLFSGQGSQYISMGRALYSEFDVFQRCVDDCATKLQYYMDCDLRSLLFPTDVDDKFFEKQLEQTEYTQPAIFVIEYALACLFMSFGICPDMMIGHSIGEYVAAHLSGIFSLEDALRLIARRAKIISKLEPGCMLAVSMEINALQDILPHNLSIAAVNSYDLCVISGNEVAIDKFIKQLAQYDSKIQTKLLHVSHAFHSHMMDQALEEFQDELKYVSFGPCNNTIISTVSGRKISSVDMSCADYWLRHLRNTVLFTDAISTADDLGCNFYLEIGPGDVLTRLIKLQQIRHHDICSCNTLPNVQDFKNDDESTIKTFYSSLGELWRYNINIDWGVWWVRDCVRIVSVPTYSFDKTEYVVLPDMANRSNADLEVSNKSGSLSFYKPVWVIDNQIAESNIDSCLAVQAGWLIFSDKLGIGKALQEFLKKHNQLVFLVYAGTNYVKKSTFEYIIQPSNKKDYLMLFNSIKESTISIDHIVYLFGIYMRDYDDKQIEYDHVYDYNFYGLINCAKFFLKNSNNNPDLIVVSNQTKLVLEDDFIYPEKSIILGPFLVISQEHKIAKSKFIDIDYPKSTADWNAQLILKEILTPAFALCNNNIIVYREKRRFLQSFQTLFFDFHDDAYLVRLEPKDVYLITGGLGKLGLQIAKYLAMQDEVKLILLGRSLLPDRNTWTSYIDQAGSDDKVIRQIKQIQEIEDMGSIVCIYSLDIGDEFICQKTINTIEKAVGHINGIIHAVGVTGNAGLLPLENIENKHVEQQFSAKIQGLNNIFSSINTEKLRFCVLFSSVSSFMGGEGYAIYAAANQYLDAYASQYHKNTNIHIVSINWDYWGDNGATNNNGIIPVVSGLKALGLILNTHLSPEIIVSDNNWLLRMHYLDKLKSKLEPGKKHDSNISDIQQVDYVDYETIISDVFKQCLDLDKVNLDDDFYNLGGNSLLAVRLIVMLDKRFDLRISLSELNQTRTVRRLLEWYKRKGDATIIAPIVELKDGDDIAPLFIFHPVNGSVSGYFELAKYLNYDGPIIGIQDSTLNQQDKFSSLEEMAGFYLQYIQQKQKHGPYLLMGASLGGNLAYEVARQLNDREEVVSFLGLLDSWSFFSDKLRNKGHFEQIMQERLGKLERSFIDDSITLNDFIQLIWHRMHLLCNYQPKPTNIQMVLFKASDLQPEYQEVDHPFNHWDSYAEHINLEFVPGDHESMLKSPHVLKLAEKLNEYL